jgi:NAD(P)H-dependent nitrite reductase small subunit
VTEEFLTVATIDEMPNGTVRVVRIGSYDIGIYHIDDEWYAIDNICPHAGAPLDEGWVHDKTVTCPWHAWCFSLETGRMTMWDMDGLDTFAIKVEDGTVKLNPKPKPRPQAAPVQATTTEAGA